MNKAQKQKLTRRLKIFGLVVALCFIVLTCLFLAMDLPRPGSQDPGITFSKPYAEKLGLNADETLQATLDDLQVKRFRIPAYWSLLETQKDQWDWTWLDNELDVIAQRNGHVVLAVGEKLPRWPECWIPDWATSLSANDRERVVKDYLTAVINRYNGHPAVMSWQLENEPGFPFGTCPKIRPGFYDDELALVRSLSDKPISSTDSGELSLWRLGRKVDTLGFSVYRVVYGPIGIFHYWFVPPQFYLRKAQILGWSWGIKKLYISEFQMEPWTWYPTLVETPINDQMKTFDIKQMQQNIAFAQNSGISTIDYWGVEWWYWMKTVQNRPEFWELAKTIFRP